MKKWANKFNKTFQRKKSNIPKTHEEMLNNPGHKEMQIKITSRVHLTLVRMATKKIKNNKCWQGYGGKETLLHC
jgi:hypothetical protein